MKKISQMGNICIQGLYTDFVWKQLLNKWTGNFISSFSLVCFPGAHDSRGYQGSDTETVCYNGGGPGYHQGKVIVSLDMDPEFSVYPQRKVPPDACL